MEDTKMQLDWTMLFYVIPGIIGWLVKSPLSKSIPPRLLDWFGRLTQEDYNEAVALVTSKDARRQAVANQIQKMLANNKINVPDYVALEMVDALAKAYKKKLAK
jgi:hypothetical protein